MDTWTDLHSLNHLVIHTLTHPLLWVWVCALPESCRALETDRQTDIQTDRHSVIQSLAHPFIHSPIHAFTHSLIDSHLPFFLLGYLRYVQGAIDQCNALKNRE